MSSFSFFSICWLLLFLYITWRSVCKVPKAHDNIIITRLILLQHHKLKQQPLSMVCAQWGSNPLNRHELALLKADMVQLSHTLCLLYIKYLSHRGMDMFFQKTNTWQSLKNLEGLFNHTYSCLNVFPQGSSNHLDSLLQS